jgi:hypothetical protein
MLCVCGIGAVVATGAAAGDAAGDGDAAGNGEGAGDTSRAETTAGATTQNARIAGIDAMRMSTGPYEFSGRFSFDMRGLLIA